MYYQREWEIVFSLYICFIYYSQLEKEEKNAKEGKEKVETEKVKREAVQVVVPGHRKQVTFLPSRRGPAPSF